MPVSYDNLWKLLIDKKLKRTDLKELCGISSNVLAKLGKDEPISMESLEKICNALNCNIDDVVFFVERNK
ncbi:MAG TPA: Cro/Cl family transcriptional regulator [Clostridiales bacterium]|jgi:putative transcriptional regulator|nr:XRE family transcriptional regulator [Clostridiales bacterium]HBL81184.1 Cro/Cl family transcriptional regulator [Clostridiales bacterium]